MRWRSEYKNNKNEIVVFRVVINHGLAKPFSFRWLTSSLGSEGFHFEFYCDHQNETGNNLNAFNFSHTKIGFFFFSSILFWSGRIRMWEPILTLFGFNLNESVSIKFHSFSESNIWFHLTGSEHVKHMRKCLFAEHTKCVRNCSISMLFQFTILWFFLLLCSRYFLQLFVFCCFVGCLVPHKSTLNFF